MGTAANLAPKTEHGELVREIVSRAIDSISSLSGQERINAIVGFARRRAESGVVDETLETLRHLAPSAIDPVERERIVAIAYRRQGELATEIASAYRSLAADDTARIHSFGVAAEEEAEARESFAQAAAHEAEAQRMQSVTREARVGDQPHHDGSSSSRS